MRTNALLFIFLLAGCSSDLSEKELLHKSNPEGHYGLNFSKIDKSSIQDLISNEKQYLDRDVFLSGEIIEVCPMRGCWIKLNDKSTTQNLRVKVTDGEIVFPLSSKGMQADVQGKFIKLDFTEDQARQWKVHLAKEKGIDISPSDVALTSSDLFEYRVIGKGAKIYSPGCSG